MYNLLIEDKLDGFSVREARDAILPYGNFKDSNQARNVIYRQILSFLNKGWLREVGEGHKKRYWITEIFKELSVEPKDSKKMNGLKKLKKAQFSTKTAVDFQQLRKEKNQYEGDLSIILNEIDELRSLIERFPYKEEEWRLLILESKERSAMLLGRISALEKVLELHAKEAHQC